MDKQELLKSLKKMFGEEKEKEEGFRIENRQIDRNSYLSLVVNDNEESVSTHPDYEKFVSALRSHNTKTLNYVALKLSENRKKIFVEFSEEKKEKFLEDTRDLYQRLVSSTEKNAVLIEDMISDWADSQFE